MLSRLFIWFERHQRRATVVIGAAAVLLAQLGLAYVAGDRYQAAIGRALNPRTTVSPADTPQVGPPLRVAAGSRDAGTATTPAPTIAERTVGNEPSTPVAATEGAGTTPSDLTSPGRPAPPETPPPPPRSEPDRGSGESPPAAVVRQDTRDEEPEAASDGGRVRRDPESSDDRGPKGDREDDEEREQIHRASSRSEKCSASWSERHDERDEACEERGRDQRDERDESRVDGGQEDEHRSSVERRDERRSA